MPEPLGAPGIRVAPPEPVQELTGVRRDVAAFLGIAPRGPAHLPAAALEPDTELVGWLTGPRPRSVAVPVDSWDVYRRTFGGFEGPGRLPYAVSAFFAQGGERAWVVRIVAPAAGEGGPDVGRAAGRLGSLATTAGVPVELLARDEGRWGDGLRGGLTFATRPLREIADGGAGEVLVAPEEWVPDGSLLRVRLPGDVQVLRFVESSQARPDPAGPGSRRHLTTDTPLPPQRPRTIEVVTAVLDVVDADPTFARSETIAGIGLSPEHPRWLARVVAAESALVWPGAGWAGGRIAVPDPSLRPVGLAGVVDGTAVPRMTGGADRWARIVPADFGDPAWTPGDERPGSGVHALAENGDIGLLLAPDLYEPFPLAPVDDVADPVPTAGPWFEPCLDAPDPPPPTPRPPGLEGLALDPTVPADLAEIVRHQRELVDAADRRRDLTVLLDVPPGLPQRRILEWRNAFDSPFAAAYHPWLDVSTPDDARDALIRVPPSAFAAGIVADRERRLGVAHGPFREIAMGAVRAAVPVTGPQHDELHPAGINVFRAERDGVRLLGARTLSRAPELRQLSVARLTAVLRLTLEREMAWLAFEPNAEMLWGKVRRTVHAFLSRLHEAGAFRGATAREAFFVRCDRSTMTTNDVDHGRFVCQIGFAPAEPVEYLVLNLARDRDDGVRVEVAGR